MAFLPFQITNPYPIENRTKIVKESSRSPKQYKSNGIPNQKENMKAPIPKIIPQLMRCSASSVGLGIIVTATVIKSIEMI